MSIARSITPRRLIPALVALGLACCGWATFAAYSAPATELREKQVAESDLSAQAGFGYTVELTGATSVWPKGTRLEADRALYSYAGNPVLHIKPYVETVGALGGTATAMGRTGAQIKGLSLAGKPLWQVDFGGKPAETNLRFEALTAAPQRLFGPELTVDLNTVRDQITRIREELGFTQSAHDLVVTLEIQVNASVNGRTHDFKLQAALPFHFDGQGVMAEPLEKVRVHESRVYTRTEKETVLIPFGRRLQKQTAPLSAGAVLLFGIPLSLYLARRAQSQVAAETPDHRRFKAWITEGRVSREAAVRTDVNSLEGLVDLAIDMNKRVIFDREQRSYHVLDGEILYLYKAEGSESTIHGKSVPLGRILVKSGLLTTDDLSKALEYQRTVNRPLGECLIALDFVDEITLYTTLASQADHPYVELDPDQERIDATWVQELNFRRARLFGVLPLGVRPDDMLVVAISNPLDGGALEAVGRILDRPLLAVISRPSLITKCLDRLEKGTLGQPIGGHTEELFSPIPARRDRALIKALAPGELIPLGLILKTAGFVPEETLSYFHSLGRPLRRSLMESGRVHPDALQLATGAQHAGAADLLEVLHSAGRLPLHTVLFVRQSAQEQGLTPAEVLTRYFLSSDATIRRAEQIVSALSILLFARSS